MKNNYFNIFLISWSWLIWWLLNYIYHPLMLKYLTLEQFWEFWSLVWIFNILGFFVSWFIYFLTREISKNLDDKDKVKSIFLESSKILFIIWVFIYFCFLLSSFFISWFIWVEKTLLFIVWINVIFSFLWASTSAILMWYKKFEFLWFQNILNPFLKLLLWFILVYFWFEVYGAVFWFIFSWILWFWISFIYILNFLKNYKNKNTTKEIFIDFLDNKKSILNFFFTAISFWFLMNIDVILAKNLFPSDIAWIYAWISVLWKFLIFILMSIETVYYWQIMEYKKENLPKHLLINPIFLITLCWSLAIIVNIFIWKYLLLMLKPELADYTNYYLLILFYYFLLAFISFFSKILTWWGNYIVNFIMGFISIILISLVYIFWKLTLLDFILSLIISWTIWVIFIWFYFFINYKKRDN